MENYWLELIGGISGIIGLAIGWLIKRNPKAQVVLLDIADCTEWCQGVVEAAQKANIPHADTVAYYRSKLEDHLTAAGLVGDPKRAALDKLVKDCVELAKGDQSSGSGS